MYCCDECSLLYTRPRMDESESLTYLSNNPTPIMRHMDAKSPVGKNDFFYHLLNREITSRGKALDIGAFTGRSCYIRESLNSKAYGLESQEEAVKFAMENGLKVLTGSFPENIPNSFLHMNFTLVSLIEVIYYLNDLKKSLRKIREMLLPGDFCSSNTTREKVITIKIKEICCLKGMGTMCRESPPGVP